MNTCKYCGAPLKDNADDVCYLCQSILYKIGPVPDDVLVKILEDVKGDLIMKKRTPEVHQLEEVITEQMKQYLDKKQELLDKRKLGLTPEQMDWYNIAKCAFNRDVAELCKSEALKVKECAVKTLKRNVNVLRKSYAYYMSGERPGISEPVLRNDFYKRAERKAIVDTQFSMALNHLMRTGEARIVRTTPMGERVIHMRRPT